ncbi:MAG TPA: hypothetical protein VEU33_37745, partial [Archangium sp.]|nr:hypothetical protein [Archangium sp.]
MRTESTRSPARWAPWLLLGLGPVLLVPLAALARGGSGENYQAPSSDRDSGGGGGAIPIELIY